MTAIPVGDAVPSGGLRRFGGHRQGDRDLLPALGTPALSRPSDAQPGCQGFGGSLARVQGPRHRRLPGALTDYENELPSATTCFMDDFEACIAHLRMPINHRRAIRTRDLLERLFVEERRRLKLMFGTMIRVAERWRAIRVTDLERRQMQAVRKGLDLEYETQNGLTQNPSALKPRPQLSTNSRT